MPFSPLPEQTEPGTMAACLQGRAAHEPERLAFAFLSDGLTEESPITYGELHAQARTVAATLLARGAAGRRVLLAIADGRDYVAAFFGCLYAGAVAVPIYPPSLTRPDLRFQAIVDDARPCLALTSATFHSQMQRRLQDRPDLNRVQWLVTGDLPEAPAELALPIPAPEDVAFLQYTSGSTATPKGVMVTHGNLVANVRMLKAALELSAESVTVTWLPMYHDMGLIGCVILPLFLGAPCYSMPPTAFLQRPMRWLQVITRYRGQITAAPNFAFDLCVSKATPEQVAALDLSSWRVAVSGAEPVRAETLERFARTFGPCGFRPETIFPAFGLAEATLIVSGKRGQVPPRVLPVLRAAMVQNRAVPLTGGEAQTFVSCGPPVPGAGVRIVDPEELTECRPGHVGEVWVSGPAVAAGYWQRPEETARTFGNRLGAGEERYLRTGDLGFLHDGELYITGRLKDLMIIRGQNLYPQDVEWAVQDSHPAIRPGCCAAFSADMDGEERVFVVAEVERQFRNGDLAEVVRAIRQQVVEHYGVQVYGVALLRPVSVPKTSSGKIRRQACKKAFLDGTLEALWTDINHKIVTDARQAADD